MRAAFAPLAPTVAGVFLWGSHAEGTATVRSDVDVCIVGGLDATPGDVLRAAWRLPAAADPRFDIRVFEELPLHLKADVIERGVLILSRDAPALYEYLRPARREWEDQAHRNRMRPEEVALMMEAWRRRALRSR